MRRFIITNIRMIFLRINPIFIFQDSSIAMRLL